MLEQCLLLADKYDMPVVTQTMLQQTLFSSGAEPYSLDPSKPSFALHWLALADKLQLPELVSSILHHVQVHLAQVAAQPGAMDALLSWAHEHLSKQQLMQLLQASMQHAASRQQQLQQQQQLPEPLHMMLVVPSSCSPVPSWGQQQQQQRQQNSQVFAEQAASGAPWDPATNSAIMAAAAAAASAAEAFNRIGSRRHTPGSGSGSGQGLESVEECSSSSFEEDQNKASHHHQQQHQQQRLSLCQASALFAPSAPASSGEQQQEPVGMVDITGPGASAAAPAATVFAALPVTPPQQQQQQQRCLGVPGSSPNFGYCVNAGNTSIEDWMQRSFPMQSEGMYG
jgi:hypothetical protein